MANLQDPLNLFNTSILSTNLSELPLASYFVTYMYFNMVITISHFSNNRQPVMNQNYQMSLLFQNQINIELVITAYMYGTQEVNETNILICIKTYNV